MSDVWEGPMILRRWSVMKQTGKVVIATTAKVGNGTVTMAAIKAKDTEFYQVNKTGDYVQEAH
jgi:hypothetical protein